MSNFDTAPNPIHRYTLTGLFGGWLHMPANSHENLAKWDEPVTCLKCGALVTMPNVHQNYHNYPH